MKEGSKKDLDFLVIGNSFLGSESIYYYGKSELEAYRHYRRAKAQNKGRANIYLAYVYTQYIRKVLFVSRYEIIKKIK